MLDNCTEAPAVALAERMRQRVETHHDAEVGPVTLSLGVATLGDSETVDELIARADAALYASKHGGRNRWSVSPAISQVASI